MTAILHQAFISAWRAGAFGLTTDEDENSHYTPTKGTAWAQIRCLQNPREAFTLSDLDNTTGVWQFVLYYPTGEGAHAARAKADAVFAAFPIGRRVTYSGQVITITGHHSVSAEPEAGWFKLVCRLTFEADLAR